MKTTDHTITVTLNGSPVSSKTEYFGMVVDEGVEPCQLWRTTYDEPVTVGPNDELVSHDIYLAEG